MKGQFLRPILYDLEMRIQISHHHPDPTGLKITDSNLFKKACHTIKKKMANRTGIALILNLDQTKSKCPTCSNLISHLVYCPTPYR